MIYSNKGISETAKQFEKQINRFIRKYENKALSASERNVALSEIAIFNDQVKSFAIQFGDNFQSEVKNEALAVISSLKKMSAGIEGNIHENTPDSEFF